MGKNQAVEKAEYIVEAIGKTAYQALLEEVYTVPKPGLVDPYSCGAHTDMDVETFEKVQKHSIRGLSEWHIRDTTYRVLRKNSSGKSVRAEYLPKMQCIGQPIM